MARVDRRRAGRSYARGADGARRRDGPGAVLGRFESNAAALPRSIECLERLASPACKRPDYAYPTRRMHGGARCAAAQRGRDGREHPPPAGGTRAGQLGIRSGPHPLRDTAGGRRWRSGKAPCLDVLGDLEMRRIALSSDVFAAMLADARIPASARIASAELSGVAEAITLTRQLATEPRTLTLKIRTPPEERTVGTGLSSRWPISIRSGVPASRSQSISRTAVIH